MTEEPQGNAAVAGQLERGVRPLAEACPTCGSDCNERDELIKAEREIERLRAMHAALPRLPTPRLLASGTIAGKRIELHGWHTEDIEIWQRQHGLKFGA
jgi:hypothetical protein